jgi:hypothetical protein
MLIKNKGKLKCSFAKSWGIQVEQEKTTILQIEKSLGKTDAGK